MSGILGNMQVESTKKEARYGTAPSEENVSTPFESPESRLNNDNGEANVWSMPDEEKQEAYDNTKTKTQVKLDPLQLCLFPTYLSLSEETLQEDLRENLQQLVSSKLVKDYGEDNFVYFAFTDAKIDWYSGEKSQPICGSLRHVLPGNDVREFEKSSRDATTAATTAAAAAGHQQQPCTCALYSGATVVLQTTTEGIRTSDTFEDPEMATPEVLEPKISRVLIESLVESLRDDEPGGIRQRPFYTELKGASVSWSAAQRLQGGKLVYLDKDENTEQLLVTAPDDLENYDKSDNADESTVIDVVNPNKNNFNAIEEGSTADEGSDANAFSTTRGKILAGTLGALLMVALLVLFCRLRFQKQKRRKEQQGTFSSSEDGGKNVNDTSTVISHDELADAIDEEIANGGRRMMRMNKKKKKKHNNKEKRSARDSVSSASGEDGENHDDESEAAQYKNGILDSISVGSEWTLTTTGGGELSSALGLGGSSITGNNKTMAEMLATKETFDRDRQITLQKDMLQSEWSGAVSPPSSLGLSRIRSRSRSGGNKHKNSKHHHQHHQQQQQPNSMNTNTNSTNRQSPQPTNTTSLAADPNALQFEEAGGEGEEIFLMQPAR